jgi:hypothetical protein
MGHGYPVTFEDEKGVHTYQFGTLAEMLEFKCRLQEKQKTELILIPELSKERIAQLFEQLGQRFSTAR